MAQPAGSTAASLPQTCKASAHLCTCHPCPNHLCLPSATECEQPVSYLQRYLPHTVLLPAHLLPPPLHTHTHPQVPSQSQVILAALAEEAADRLVVTVSPPRLAADLGGGGGGASCGPGRTSSDASSMSGGQAEGGGGRYTLCTGWVVRIVLGLCVPVLGFGCTPRMHSQQRGVDMSSMPMYMHMLARH
jgi:hypothetical protein